MSNQITPSTATTTTTSMPSAVPSLTDWHTWISLLTSVGALASVVFHKDLSAYIPLVAITLAAATNIVLMITKHSYAKALVTASNAIDVASTVAPSSLSNELQTAVKVADAVNQIQSALKPVVAAAAPVVTAVENSANVAPVTTS